jgi:hypothetical protein
LGSQKKVANFMGSGMSQNTYPRDTHGGGSILHRTHENGCVSPAYLA